MDAPVSVDETETHYFFAGGEKIHGKQYMHELLMQSTSQTALGGFYLHSHLYNIHGLVDPSGNVIERYKYEAYGKRSVEPAGHP